MTPEDISTYRANYDRAAWERITQGWRLHVAPPGAILAINALCDEVERLREALERVATTSLSGVSRSRKRSSTLLPHEQSRTNAQTR